MTDDFRDDPAFLRDEAKRQAALATGAMREADGWKRLADDNGAEAMRRGKEVVALREQLRGAVKARDKLDALVTEFCQAVGEPIPVDAVARVRELRIAAERGQ